MHDLDARHPNPVLERKLRALYGLRRGGRLALGFREPYLNLLRALGDPHLRLPPLIHVAGTNGKGSSIAFLRGILEVSGYKVHTYTSPHLTRFNERIRLAGKAIEDNFLEILLDETLSANAGAEATFFEITTALAFTAFTRVPADILLLETGLGGRLDCTNVVKNPQLCVITTISSDHTEFLGPTLRDIAGEKAGIMKPGRPCVIGVQTGSGIAQGVGQVFSRKAKEIDSQLFRHGSEWFIRGSDRVMRFTFEGRERALPAPSLAGPHQIGNAGTALAALEVIHKDFPVSLDSIHKGLIGADWPGRLQKIESGAYKDTLPSEWELWIDGGHNDSAGAALAEQARAWAQKDGKALHLIVGMMGAKHPKEFLSPLLPFARSLAAIPIPGESGSLPPETILAAAPDFREKSKADTLSEALAALSLRTSPGRVLVTGSLYLAGHVLSRSSAQD